MLQGHAQSQDLSVQGQAQGQCIRRQGQGQRQDMQADYKCHLFLQLNMFVQNVQYFY